MARKGNGKNRVGPRLLGKSALFAMGRAGLPGKVAPFATLPYGPLGEPMMKGG
jgi:hypothetical protein